MEEQIILFTRIPISLYIYKRTKKYMGIIKEGRRRGHCYTVLRQGPESANNATRDVVAEYFYIYYDMD